MKWLLAELQRLDQEAPDDKVIVISQFTTALDLVEDYLRNNDVKTCRYQGNMSTFVSFISLSLSATADLAFTCAVLSVCLFLP
jgi:SNF2 family DNA or RNA helicase